MPCRHVVCACCREKTEHVAPLCDGRAANQHSAEGKHRGVQLELRTLRCQLACLRSGVRLRMSTEISVGSLGRFACFVCPSVCLSCTFRCTGGASHLANGTVARGCLCVCAPLSVLLFLTVLGCRRVEPGCTCIACVMSFETVTPPAAQLVRVPCPAPGRISRTAPAPPAGPTPGACAPWPVRCAPGKALKRDL